MPGFVMTDPNELRILAVLILRTIASALCAYGLIQLIIGLVGPPAGVPAAAVFRSQGVLHALSGIALWLLAKPIGRGIARRLE